MPNITPIQVIPALTSDGTNLTIPISSLKGLTDVQADPVTGDGRAIIAAIVETFADSIFAIDSTLRPTTVTVARSAMTRVGGAESETYQQSYTVNLTKVVDSENQALSPEA